MAGISTLKALEVFFRGFGTTRSFTGPNELHHPSPNIWLLSDTPSTSRKPPRVPEMIVYKASLDELKATRERLSLTRHSLCVLIDNPSEHKERVAEIKEIGYRSTGREPLFVLDISAREHFESFSVRRIVTADDADLVAKAARSRQILPQYLTNQDSDCRLYAAFENDCPIGWVRSIRTHPDCSYLSNLFVLQEYRRRGVARSMMTKLLDDDEKYGIKYSVLLSSLTGAKLYPVLGYVQQGLLLLFSPKKPKSTE